MNGIHDLGGGHGYGSIVPDDNEPKFHEEWEKRVFSLFLPLAAGGCFNLDEFRFAIERMDPTHYLASSYYEHWLHSFETLLLEKGIITQTELESGQASLTAGKTTPILTADMVEQVVLTGSSNRRATERMPRFKIGDSVKARNINPATHTRLPRYIRGKQGTIDVDHGSFLLPDTSSQGLGDYPQQVYCVRFSARELWGEQASLQDFVYISMWDDYLEQAS